MTIVVGVRFKDSGKTYHFDPQAVPLASGDWVIVETVRGPELGRVATLPTDIPPDQLFSELKPVLRQAVQADLDNLLHLQQYEPEALQMCAEKIAEHKLSMHLVKAEYNFDGSRLTFFFTADKRVDFRALVRDLARTFRTRIELRQVGPRDEAKLLGGIGPCGRLLCCSTFLPDFARVSIKMAKDQDLPLNPSKISGVCGRLLCCLSYEHEQYLEIKAELPQRGDWVQTPEGPGEVVAVNVVKECVTVQLTDGNTLDCTAQQILEVRKRVAAEAQARNVEGITPASQRGPHPVVAGEEGLLSELDELHDLSGLEEPDLLPPGGASGRSQPLRPDVALGASVNQRRRDDTARSSYGQDERSQPNVERSDAQPEPKPPSAWQPQMSLEPHKEQSGGISHHKKHGSRQQAAPPNEAQASGTTQAPATQDPKAANETAAQAQRRRKRHRGRGGKN